MKAMAAAFVGALVGATTVLIVEATKSPSSPTLTAAEVVAILQKEKAPLQDQISQLLHDVETLRATPGAARVEVTPTPMPPLDLGPITSRLDELSKRLEALTADRSVAAQKPPEAKTSSLKDDQRVATDRGATEKERIAALRRLRGKYAEDGQDARSHDVILALVDIAEHSDDSDSRLEIYRDLHGATDAALKESMLRALAQDPSAKVRAKVAEDIDTFLDDPQVKKALRVAADNDADTDVRSWATITLAGGKRKKS